MHFQHNIKAVSKHPLDPASAASISHVRKKQVQQLYSVLSTHLITLYILNRNYSSHSQHYSITIPQKIQVKLTDLLFNDLSLILDLFASLKISEKKVENSYN